MDLILKNKDNNKYLAIECKFQKVEGTAYEKLSYTLDDIKACPIPAIIVFSGNGIKNDMKSKLITSGKGIEVEFVEGSILENDEIIDLKNIFREIVYINLGMDFFKFM